MPSIVCSESWVMSQWLISIGQGTPCTLSPEWCHNHSFSLDRAHHVLWVLSDFTVTHLHWTGHTINSVPWVLSDITLIHHHWIGHAINSVVWVTPSPKQPFSFLGWLAIKSARHTTQLFSSVPAGVWLCGLWQCMADSTVGDGVTGSFVCFHLHCN